jgi:hypothetical protein
MIKVKEQTLRQFLTQINNRVLHFHCFKQQNYVISIALFIKKSFKEFVDVKRFHPDLPSLHPNLPFVSICWPKLSISCGIGGAG